MMGEKILSLTILSLVFKTQISDDTTCAFCLLPILLTHTHTPLFEPFIKYGKVGVNYKDIIYYCCLECSGLILKI